VPTNDCRPRHRDTRVVSATGRLGVAAYATLMPTMRGMEWKLAHTTASGPPTVLEVDGVGVVRLMDRIDGRWFAVLNYHLPDSRRHRECTSYEAGRRGAELWTMRHLDRLRREAAARRSRWARLPVVADISGPQPTWDEILAERERIAATLKVAPRRLRRRR
jgi:hypothetical protein